LNTKVKGVFDQGKNPSVYGFLLFSSLEGEAVFCVLGGGLLFLGEGLLILSNFGECNTAVSGIFNQLPQIPTVTPFP